jgi:hypothetical protein
MDDFVVSKEKRQNAGQSRQRNKYRVQANKKKSHGGHRCLSLVSVACFSLQKADPSSRGILETVICLNECYLANLS